MLQDSYEFSFYNYINDYYEGLDNVFVKEMKLQIALNGYPGDEVSNVIGEFTLGGSLDPLEGCVSIDEPFLACPDDLQYLLGTVLVTVNGGDCAMELREVLTF